MPGDFSIQNLLTLKTPIREVETFSYKKNNNQKLISDIKSILNKEFEEIDYRRLEYVGPTEVELIQVVYLQY